MAKWLCQFHGRTRGAIGIFHYCEATVEADTREAANLKLYDDFDHVQTLVMTPVYEQSEVEDAIRVLEEETERGAT